MGLKLRKLLAHIFLCHDFTLDGERVKTSKMWSSDPRTEQEYLHTETKVVSSTGEIAREVTYHPDRRISMCYLNIPLFC